jgi:LuxR family maltose regulon positive regulatory protein
LLEEALEHAFAARNQTWRNELLARCVGLWLQSGEIADVLRWTERLPPREITADAAICRSYIAALILSRRFEDAAAALREFRELAAHDALGPVHWRLLTTMFAILTDQEGELSFEDADMVRAPGVDSFLAGTLLTLQAYVLLRRNQFDGARRVALRARNVLQNVSTYGLGYADVVASLADRAQGDIKMATIRCEGMFAAVRSGRRNPAWMNAATALAYIRYEENRLEDAESLCLDVLPLLSIASTIENMTSAYVTLARTKTIARRFEEANQLLDSLESVLDSGAHHRFLAQVWGEKIRCALLEQHGDRAWTLAREYGLEQRAQAGEWRIVRPYDEAWERCGSAYALLLTHLGRHAEAQRILTVLRDSARTAGYVYRELRLETLLAACCDRSGERETAFEALNRALSLTRGFGFTRGVFDETPGLTRLLKAAVESQKLRHPLPPHYLRKFENVFAGRSVQASAGSQYKGPLPLEPLTDREIDMLKLLAQGYSNSEISERSQIALSTAKWHLKNVFAKLDVSTRTSALARARELRLVD